MLARTLVLLLIASLGAVGAPVKRDEEGTVIVDPAREIIWTKNYGEYEKREEDGAVVDPAREIIWTKNYGEIKVEGLKSGN
ncbi:uncharacterized protein BO72DRAFT_525475 [Aspergillus fijiensis CBS 313.89]|uniref:Uncharacterized protein n=1 Tax=Aspergillus fijiensis CBS 313.89 TaxID=1448319 RepID=A0A8G1RWL8_9EURO|nr:uncharacterized protein BO72DRAFT_525475 [Aspergillus fijiensis CBS 313.89]RAK80249.1 hypothetical protein BO72DRAFT_525475 [Aspergillus fijiensis CBS 313.89]